MSTFLLVFLVAMALAALGTPLAMRLSVRIDALARPGGRRIHARSLPTLGGVAIATAFFVAFAAAGASSGAVREALLAEPIKLAGLLGGAAAMFAVGLADDAMSSRSEGLRAPTKLYAQIVVACAAFACGFRVDAIALPVIGTHALGFLALPITVLWLVGVINAVNLIDGLDGLAAGVVFFAGVSAFVVACATGATLAAVATAALLGAVVGFLLYNFHPAKIFMGNSGSYFLGFVLAAMSLGGSRESPGTVSLLVPAVALGVPLFDTLSVAIRRILQRRSIFLPDRGHIHHRMLDGGMTHRRAVATIYIASALFACAAVTIAVGQAWQVGLALLGSIAVLLVLLRYVGYFGYFDEIRKKARFRREAGLRS